MKITVELVQSWEPCEDYPEERLRELLGDGLAPLEVAEVDIPVDDRIWALLRREVLGAGLDRVLDAIVERAIRRSLGRSGVVAWEAWAERWLSGEDRSAGAAYAARAAAGAAAYAAAYAAYAADAADAAWAAGAAAWYAAEAAARDAAWHAECTWQEARLRELLERGQE